MDAAELTLLLFLPFLIPAFLAQWADEDRVMYWLTFGFLILLGVVSLGGGLLYSLMGLLLGRSFAAVGGGITSLDVILVGLLAGVGGALSLLLLIPFVRRLLAHVMPIDPQSPVHATALSLAALGLGLVLAQLPLMGGLETLAAQAGGLEMSFGDLLASNLPLVLFPFVGVGLWIRRDGGETLERLGLRRLNLRQVLIVVGLTVAMLTVWYGLDWVWRLIHPASYERLAQISDVLFGGLSGVWQPILLSLSAGVSEEILFRGALQPRFGLLITALLFAAVHVQYGLSPAALEVLIAGLVLGWLRRRENTSACILLHFLYNVGVFLLSTVLP